MNIHEYQAKELFEKFGVATRRGKWQPLRRRPERPPAKSEEPDWS
nr:hypothetical protein [Verrucomicrobium spinosum]